MVTPHPHARYIRRARKIPLHVRYNPRAAIVGPIYVNVPPPPYYPPWLPSEDTTVDPPPTPPTLDELAPFEDLPSGFAWLMRPDQITFLVNSAGIYLIGTV